MAMGNGCPKLRLCSSTRQLRVIPGTSSSPSESLGVCGALEPEQGVAEFTCVVWCVNCYGWKGVSDLRHVLTTLMVEEMMIIKGHYCASSLQEKRANIAR